MTAYAKAERFAKILSQSIIENVSVSYKSDSGSYFTDTAKGLLTGIILLVSEYGDDEERHIISVFRLIIELNGLEEGSSDMLQKSKLASLLENVDNDRITNYVGSAMKADNKTSMNIFSSALSKLVDFIDAELEQLVCEHSEDFSDINFIQKPTAIFLICPDDNTTRHFFASLFIRYMMNDLINQAESTTKHRLSRNVLCFWDEFGNMPAIKDIDVLITAARSRGIRFVLSLQSLSQLEKTYQRTYAEIIKDALQMIMISKLAPGSETTPQKFSKILGNRTIQTGSTSKTNGKTTKTFNMMAQPLMSADELTRIPIGTFIVMKSGKLSCKVNLPLFTDYLPCPKPYISSIQNEVKKVQYLTSASIRRKACDCIFEGMFDADSDDDDDI